MSTAGENSSRWPWWLAGIILAIAIGAALRLVRVEDMEYKYDECWTYLQTRPDCPREASSWLGIHGSTGFRNPGMSLWVFLGLARLFDAREPTDLARAVQVCNVLALVVLGWFACRMVPAPEREPWLWATALAAVNPLTVVFQRKIWPPSVLPLLSMLMLVAWWRRERRGGAFCWGLLAVVLGQIHPSGFFLAAAFAVWAVLFERRRIAWSGWLAGSALGGLPLVPWMCYLLTAPRDRFVSHPNWQHILEGKFWIRWGSESFGLGLEYSIFTDMAAYLRYPLIAGVPTYLVALLHGVVAVLAVFILGRAGWNLCRHCGYSGQAWRDRWIGRGSSSAMVQSTALWGFGLILTFSTLSVHRHYAVILFPLEFLWLARMALMPATGSIDLHAVFRPGRALLLSLIVAQGLITVTFLDYIHHSGGSRVGDYGTVYRLDTIFRNLKPEALVVIRNQIEEESRSKK